MIVSFCIVTTTIKPVPFSRVYRKRWPIERLLKGMKQHPHVKAFFGTTANAVKTQLWIAVMVYALVHVLKARRGPTRTPNQIMQVPSVMISEKTSINEVFSELAQKNTEVENPKQPSLFKF